MEGFERNCFGVGLRMLYVILVTATVSGHKYLDNNVYVGPEVDIPSEESSCARQMARVYRDDVMTPYPPILSGEWTSLRCEVRPGPEFLLRKYIFYDGSHFLLHQFYYEDSGCTNPLYSLVARGSYSVFQASWLLSGATEMDYELNQVTVIPYTDKMASILATRVNKTCPGHVRKSWRKGNTYDIFNFFEVPQDVGDLENAYLMADLDCLDALSFSLHELQLLRLEKRFVHHHVEQKLHLGDIHTQPSERRTYRPTGFQDPLLLTEQIRGCPTCERIRDSSEFNPPYLPHHHQPTLELTGSWFSEHCETRPNGVFLIRHLSFVDDSKTWEGFYHHFLDGNCQRPLYTLYVKGKLALITSSKIIQGAYEMDFKILEASIKPTDMNTVVRLNQEASGDQRCGINTIWKLNRQHDVTSTDGCPALGITLLHVEFEILKLDTQHRKSRLFLGQRPTEEENKLSPHKRPTSFQPALLRCSDEMKAVTPTYQFHPIVYPSSASVVVSESRLFYALLTLVVSAALNGHFN